MSALNTVTPSPMPAAVAPTSPVQGSAPANASEQRTQGDQQGSFANTLDAKVKANQGAQSQPPQGKAVDGKGSAEQSDDAQASGEDPAQLAQIAAALLAAFGATPNADKAVEATPAASIAPAATEPAAAASDASALPQAGNLLPTAAVTAAANGAQPGANNAPPTATGNAPANSGQSGRANLLPTATVPAAAVGAQPGASSADPDGGKIGATLFSSQVSSTATSDHPKATDINAAQSVLATVRADSAAAITAQSSKEALASAVPTQKLLATDTPIQAGDATQAAAQALSATTASRTAEAARTDAPQFAVRTPVSQQGWADDVGNRMVWMAGKELGRAELILTPPHLGRVEITLHVNGDQTTASFVTATPAAREAIEQSLPRLRELMTDAGLSLGQVNVSANSTKDPSQENPGWSGGSRTGSRTQMDEGDVIPAASRAVWSAGRGMIDTFA